MPRFHYKAARPDGTIIETDGDGETSQSLRSQLEAQGLLVLDLAGSGARQIVSRKKRQRPLALRDFLIFNQEFLALLKAGLPMLRCFDLLAERNTQGGFQQALQSVREHIRGGSAISEAMTHHPTYFPELYQASLRAGEQAGNLPEVLSRYIAYLKMLIGVREKVVKATIYPIFLLGFGLLVTMGLLFFVLPSFAEVYQESRVELPWATQLLIDLTHSATQWMIGLLIFIGIAGMVIYWWKNTPQGQWQIHWLFLHAPVLGPLFLKNQVIRLARTLSTILGGGIPLLSALQVTAKSMPNKVFAKALQSVIVHVREGTSLSAALKKENFLPRLTLEMVEVGETTGSLEAMLFEVAEFHEGELDFQLSRLMTWIEPMFIILIGVILGGVVIALYLPIFQMAGAV
ncbi:type II secretion system F family protein [Candidatus Nitrospira allomarina]|uniref:Type II secretion system F family protein n=1 Tax=Candidatus Nitrospira allomarina TaxID=3020900 RepID=A0AA96GBH8_9BACT|nr:type II secretion system F family protein [Candidatus Nitrospira allomarina]WNM57100.1 type II secretion system F family protein [Candidatus Nitrospira allomarina]